MNLRKGVFYKFETKNCSVCKMMEPVLQEFLNNNPDVILERVNATDEMDLCEKLGIMAMPTFLYIEDEADGTPEMISGLVERKDFAKFTKQFLKAM